MASRSAIVVMIIFILAMVVVQTGFSVVKTMQVTNSFTGKASSEQGEIFLCINEPVTLLPYPCSVNITEDVQYNCQLLAYDPDNATQTLTFTARNVSGALVYTLNSSGYFSTIPVEADMLANNTMEFMVSDNTGCAGGTDAYNVTFVNIPVNDPPIYLPREGLAEDMGPYEWDEGSSLRGVYLNQYFDDPDGDPLNYSASIIESPFGVTIIQATSEVIFSSTDCGTGYVFLRATDPYNLWVESDLIELNVECEPDDPPPSGGGGSSPKGEQRCVPDWQCDDWSRCFKNGTQRRVCTDVNACQEEYIKYFWRECEYLEQCNNKIQDFFYEGSPLNEDGVDCGGPCPVCETCFDFILNNGEEEVDCGGPNCDPCSNCFNGIQDYDETGVDCGGPVCDACPSCFDGIQNQNETGVDCGGPCPVCRRVEQTDLIAGANRFLQVMIPILAFLVALAIVYRIFRRQIKTFFAHFKWFLKRKHSKQILLTEEQKNILLAEIRSLEGGQSIEFSDELTHESVQYDTAIILRKYFRYLIGSSMDIDEVSSKIDKIKTTGMMKKILKDHYMVLLLLERKKHFSPEEIKLQVELLRQRVLSTAKIKHADVARVVNEMQPEKEKTATRCTALLYNAVLAIQFHEVDIAKKKYLDALHTYDHLSPKTQGRIYDALNLVFMEIGYVSAYADKEE